MAELMKRKPVEIYLDVASIHVIILIVIKVQITSKACVNVKYIVYFYYADLISMWDQSIISPYNIDAQSWKLRGENHQVRRTRILNLVHFLTRCLSLSATKSLGWYRNFVWQATNRLFLVNPQLVDKKKRPRASKPHLILLLIHVTSHTFVIKRKECMC